jgi:hypothetical protein
MCNYQLKVYRRLHILTVQYADSALAQPSRDKTHLGFLKDFKQTDRIKRVETGDTRLGYLKYGIWLGLRPLTRLM